MSALRKPSRLSPGGTIGVAALSGAVDEERLASGVAALSSMGLRVRLAANVLSRSGTLGLAGSDEERLAGYRELLLDPEVEAIVFSRGGYGAGRILSRLDPNEIARVPKIHCGFSDVTAVSAFLLSRCGIPSFHGPLVATDLAQGLDPRASSSFPSMLMGSGPPLLSLRDADVLVPGSASGILVGGCLSLLAALVGTPEEFDYDGAVVFFEDVAEEAYRLDRMLGALLRAGRFDKIRAILVGGLTRITFSGVEDPARLRALLLERLSPLGVPVVTGLPAGHGVSNVTLPIGARVTWDAPSRALRFEEDIVR